MGMYHCKKGWGKGVVTWGNPLLAIFLGLNITVFVLLTFLSSLPKIFTRTLDLCGLVIWGSFVFSGEVLLLKDDPDLYLIVCASDS